MGGMRSGLSQAVCGGAASVEELIVVVHVQPCRSHKSRIEWFAKCSFCILLPCQNTREWPPLLPRWFAVLLTGFCRSSALQARLRSAPRQAPPNFYSSWPWPYSFQSFPHLAARQQDGITMLIVYIFIGVLTISVARSSRRMCAK